MIIFVVVVCVVIVSIAHWLFDNVAGRTDDGRRTAVASSSQQHTSVDRAAAFNAHCMSPEFRCEKNAAVCKWTVSLHTSWMTASSPVAGSDCRDRDDVIVFRHYAKSGTIGVHRQRRRANRKHRRQTLYGAVTIVVRCNLRSAPCRRCRTAYRGVRPLSQHMFIIIVFIIIMLLRVCVCMCV